MLQQIAVSVRSHDITPQDWMTVLYVQSDMTGDHLCRFNHSNLLYTILYHLHMLRHVYMAHGTEHNIRQLNTNQDCPQ